MDERTRRIGTNEALFREVNDQVESLNRELSANSDPDMEIVCECGDPSCARRLAVTGADYARIRSDAALFFVVPGHERPDVEQVVEETAGYDVVRKHEGDAADIARATYSRDG
jgi:hypothetical protein